MEQHFYCAASFPPLCLLFPKSGHFDLYCLSNCHPCHPSVSVVSLTHGQFNLTRVFTCNTASSRSIVRMFAFSFLYLCTDLHDLYRHRHKLVVFSTTLKYINTNEKVKHLLNKILPSAPSHCTRWYKWCPGPQHPNTALFLSQKEHFPDILGIFWVFLSCITDFREFYQCKLTVFKSICTYSTSCVVSIYLQIQYIHVMSATP